MSLPPLDALLAEVGAQTGLDDFGDPTFRDGLAVLLDALDDAGLNEIGAAVAAAQVRGALANRLAVQHWWNRHPALADERVESPLFIVGMSRSGTTALSHLLARDPANRSLLGWEASSPIPPPTADTYRTDPRFEAAKANEFGLLHRLNPSIAAMHHDPPDLPVECLVPMTQHFVSLSLSLQLPVPAYTAWVLETDHASVYRWHHRILCVLQSGGVRGRWQLKSPQHAIALDALLARYPDARFIVTHRDPSTCVASTTSMADAFASTFAERRDPSEHGRVWTEVLGAIADGLLSARRRLGDERFVDVAYRDLTRDPIGTVHAIYAALGEEVTPAYEAALRDHVAVAVQHRYGRHEYSWDALGLDRGALDERFGEYRQRFAEHLL